MSYWTKKQNLWLYRHLQVQYSRGVPPFFIEFVAAGGEWATLPDSREFPKQIYHLCCFLFFII